MSAPPFERRPVTDPAEAKRVALQSMNATGQAPTSTPRQQRKARPNSPVRSTPNRAGKPLTTSAAAYLAGEERWQAHLRHKSRLGALARRSGRDVLDLAKAKRSRLRRTDAYVTGQDAGPLGKYDAKTVEELGERGLALKMPDGSWAYPIVDQIDLGNALLAYQQAEGGKPPGLHAWLVLRANALNLTHLLPKSMGAVKEKPGPREPGGGGAVGLPNVEAPGGGGAGPSEGGGLMGGAM
jgi:hypothetical protein